jgi:hypothetical protein
MTKGDLGEELHEFKVAINHEIGQWPDILTTSLHIAKAGLRE